MAKKLQKNKLKKKKPARSGKPVTRLVNDSPAGKKYILNPEFEFFRELEALILKPAPGEKTDMTSKIMGLGKIKLAVISGLFLNQPTDDDIADLFIVGDDIDRPKLSKFLRTLEAQLGQEIKFTLMSKEEYRYRVGMFDRFIRVLFDSPHEKLVDRLGI